MVVQVVSDFHPLEREPTDRMGIHYQFKILPYRTLDNKIEGVVITIVDIAPGKLGGATYLHGPRRPCAPLPPPNYNLPPVSISFTFN